MGVFLNGDRSSETALNGIPPSGGGTDTSDATMVAGDLLAGKTGYGAEGVIEGTMTNNADNDVEITDLNGTAIPEGYYNGLGVAKLSDAEAAKCIASNFPLGITILGVLGSHECPSPEKLINPVTLVIPSSPTVSVQTSVEAI